MTLDMFGHIDSTFISIPAKQITQTGGAYDGDGVWVPGAESTISYDVNIQALNPREIDSLQIGAERIKDYRKVYVNNGDFHALSPSAFWEFSANNNGEERYKVISSDIKEWRSYAKIIMCLIDGAPND